MRGTVQRVFVALAAVAALAAAGCGDSSSQDDAVRTAISRYFTALAGHDVAGACAAMSPEFSRAFMEVQGAAPGAACPSTLRKLFARSAPAHIVAIPITALNVSGDKASAQVGVAGGPLNAVQLIHSSGRWLVSCCVGAQNDRQARLELRVPSESMEPTLHVGDTVEVDQRAYATAAPRVGDLVLIHPPLPNDACAAPGEGADHPKPCSRSSGKLSIRDRFLKRIVAGPGDRIALRAGRVILNGKPVAEPFVRPCTTPGSACDFPEAIVVPPDSYYVLGDNRAASDDSRFWGPVPRRAVLGRVTPR